MVNDRNLTTKFIKTKRQIPISFLPLISYLLPLISYLLPKLYPLTPETYFTLVKYITTRPLLVSTAKVI